MVREAMLWAAGLVWLSAIGVGFWYWEQYDTTREWWVSSTPHRATRARAAGG
jgi:hypothetical protein